MTPHLYNSVPMVSDGTPIRFHSKKKQGIRPLSIHLSSSLSGCYEVPLFFYIFVLLTVYPFKRTKCSIGQTNTNNRGDS